MKRVKRRKKEIATSEYNEFIRAYEFMSNQKPHTIRAKIQDFKEYLDFIKQPHQFSLWELNKLPFPPRWLTEDKKIKGVIERCPSFLLIVKYIHNHNRYWYGTEREERKKMMEEADKITDSIRYRETGHNYVYSTFLTNQAFYKEICKHTHCSKSNIQRYLPAFVKVGFLKVLHKGKGGKGVLYADGYYVRTPDDKYRKITFLKNLPEIRTGLIQLPKWVTEYQTKLIRRVKRHVCKSLI